ncbi:MAG: tetratricopeptide repeat protein [Minicystis sp.]
MVTLITGEEYERWEREVDRLVHVHGPGPALAFVRGALASRDDRKVRIKEAQTLYFLERFDECEAILTSIVARFPDDADSHCELGGVLISGGKLEAARSHLEIAAAADRWKKLAGIRLALVEQLSGNVEKAQVMLEELLRESPGDPDVIAALVRLYEQMARGEEAIAVAAEIAHRHPEHARLHGNLGVLMLGMGRYREAVDFLTRAIEVQPEDAYWNMQAAMAYRDLGDIESSLRVLKDAHRHHPHRADFCLHLSTFSGHVGRADDELLYAERAVALAPELGEAWGCKALALAHHGRRAEAVAALREGLEHPPVSEVLLDALREEGVLP